MFFGTLFGMSFKVSCASTSFATICFFLQYLHYARSSTSPTPPLIFFLFTILKCFHTTDVRLLVLGLLPIGLGWGMIEGWLEEGALVGVEMIFKRIKFIIFINTIVKVFNI